MLVPGKECALTLERYSAARIPIRRDPPPQPASGPAGVRRPVRLAATSRAGRDDSRFMLNPEPGGAILVVCAFLT
jgi:hypothetical protein